MQNLYGISLADVIARIQQSEKNELEAMEQAIIRRYQTLFPQWEFISLSLPKDDLEERQRILQASLKILER